ncbi:MAG: hypothetical protein HN509_01450 [Halobacteriovoraceae bacterium]|jgi:hypothetical protein|nr:hypothetical protein [Halobacteriovoraceae bacterium]MBT5094721.1 hypothetical protein [Halobacteriovoraceae bacterium]
MRSLYLSLVLIFLACAPIPASANYPYFHFERKNIKLSNESFRRYIRPQLRSIISEFYHLLKKLAPLQGDLVSLKSKILKMNSQWNQLKKICPNDQEKCQDLFGKFYQEARSLDKQILVLKKSKLRYSDKKAFSQFDSLVHLSKVLDQILNRNYLLLHYIEEHKIVSDDPFFRFRDSQQKFQQLVHSMKISSEMIIVSLLDKNVRGDFDFAFSNYIKVLESNILLGNDKNFLISRLEDLNMVWNSFHMKMVKGNVKLPKALSKIIIIMHNRWNSILKIILRT